MESYAGVKRICTYEGRYKVIPAHGEGRTTRLLCRGHADDWIRIFPGARRVEPRNLDGTVLSCEGDWPLPAEVP